MDFNAPMHALWSYFNSPSTGTTPPANQPTSNQAGYAPMPAPGTYKPQPLTPPPTGMSTTSGMTAVGGGPGMSPYNFRHSASGKPIADLPKPDEVTIDIYPTSHYLVPTDLNKGTPWAAQKVPTGFLDGLAYAEAKARQVGGFENETLKQFLPLATRESRYLDYGNNGVYVNQFTPPPKHLNNLIEKSNSLQAQYNKLDDQYEKALSMGNKVLASDLNLKRADIKMNQRKIDDSILADPKWESRSDKYQNVTKKALELGLKQSENQELIRDNNGRGNIVSKADVYRAAKDDPYAIKALHVPLALYNKQIENKGAKGLALTKRYVGGGQEAEVRNAQEAEIGQNVYTHPKNRPVLDYYNQRLKHHSTNIKTKSF